MNFDEFVERLKQAFPDEDWYVEHNRFKGNDLVEIKVKFSFPIKTEHYENER